MKPEKKLMVLQSLVDMPTFRYFFLNKNDVNNFCLMNTDFNFKHFMIQLRVKIKGLYFFVKLLIAEQVKKVFH